MESTSMTIESILELAGDSIIQSHRKTHRIRPRQQINTVTIDEKLQFLAVFTVWKFLIVL